MTHGMGQIMLWHGSTGVWALPGLGFDHLYEKTCGVLAAGESLVWGRGERHFCTRRTAAALDSVLPRSPFLRDSWGGEHSLPSEKPPVRRLGFSVWCGCYSDVLGMPGASRCNQSFTMSPALARRSWPGCVL